MFLLKGCSDYFTKIMNSLRKYNIKQYGMLILRNFYNNNCKTSIVPISLRKFKLRGATNKLIWLVIHGDR